MQVSNEAGHAPPPKPSSSATYIMWLLCLTAMFNQLDRQIFAILLTPIKTEIGASDTAMGFMTGGAFALAYVIAGFPLARLADTGSRKRLISATLFVWSLMTLVCGVAQNYTQLLLARMGVAVGEAGSMPASYSQISDLYPPKARTGAISVLHFAGAVGLALSMFLGGYLADVIGWRLTLVAMAVPGMGLAITFALTVREPVRTQVTQDKPSILSVLKEAWAYRSFRCVLGMAIFAAFTGYGLLGWVPTFLIRVHHLPIREVGYLAGFGMFSIGIGSIFSGKLADYILRRSIKGLFWVPAIGLAAALPFLFIFLTTHYVPVLWVSYALAQMLYGFWTPCLFAICVTLAGNRGRALITSVLTLFQNIGGVALGPVVAGIINDCLSARYGDGGIRYSMMILTLGAVVAVFIALWGSRYIKADFERATQLTQG